MAMVAVAVETPAVMEELEAMLEGCDIREHGEDKPAAVQRVEEPLVLVRMVEGRWVVDTPVVGAWEGDDTVGMKAVAGEAEAALGAVVWVEVELVEMVLRVVAVQEEATAVEAAAMARTAGVGMG